MKKLVFALAAIASTAVFADSYLYWMVDTTTDYAYARVSADGNYLTIYDSAFDTPYTDAGSLFDGKGGGGSVSDDNMSAAKSEGEAFYAALSSVGATKSSTFLIELYNESGTFLGQQQLSGSALAFYDAGTAAPAAVAPGIASSFAIPEPSSGLLMLVGCAVLGLRRRKQKNA